MKLNMNLRKYNTPENKNIINNLEILDYIFLDEGKITLVKAQDNITKEIKYYIKSFSNNESEEVCVTRTIEYGTKVNILKSYFQ